MQEVKSSTIAAVGYDRESKELTIRFIHGGEYLYCGVSEAEHKALMDAPSIGKHFHSNIRPKYNGKKAA